MSSRGRSQPRLLQFPQTSFLHIPTPSPQDLILAKAGRASQIQVLLV